MFQDYPQSQQLQQQNICAECSHKSNHPLPFLAAHHVVRTPVSAHVSRPVRSSEREEANDDEYWYPSPKPRPHHLASSSLSAESLPSPDPSISSILSSSPSQAETWRTSLSNNGQGRPSLEGVSASSGKGKLQRHHFYAANMHNPQQERPQQQQHQQQQRQQAVNLGRKASGDYDDNPSQGSPYRGTVYTYTSDEMLGDSGSSPSSPKQHTVWILVSSHYRPSQNPFLPLVIFIYIDIHIKKSSQLLNEYCLLDLPILHLPLPLPPNRPLHPPNNTNPHPPLPLIPPHNVLPLPPHPTPHISLTSHQRPAPLHLLLNHHIPCFLLL